MEETILTPEQPDTAAMERELEQLRAEKHQRLLMEQARAALEERGIDPRFAAFVLAEDDDRTRKKVEQFDRQLTETVKNHLAAHLSAGEPRDFAVHKPQKRVRGIRKK
ncbi:MAG: DUF4355 domain-containing protein [Clostridia bacterium]|nr:DUF4355 domain-containing protein [Clostridia bacterium]